MQKINQKIKQTVKQTVTRTTNQKALLHRVSFAVLAALCCVAHAQTAQSKINFAAEEATATTQYANAVQACAAKLAPAQCQRQARLDYNQAQHAIKLRRQAADAASKQAKHDKTQADKAQNTAAAKPGINAATGKPLERAPLTKPPSNKNKPTQPLSEQQGVKNTTAPKQTMSKKTPPKTKTTAPKKPLTAQPNPDQRRTNVAEFAKKETEIAARKAQAQSKQAKRAEKDAQRRAAGYMVDKP